MEQDREIDQVLMNIRNSTGGIVSIAIASGYMQMKMLTFLLRMAKKALIPKGYAESFKGFLQKSEGNYTVYNIPLSGDRIKSLQKLNKLEVQLEKETSPFKRAGIKRQIKNLNKKLKQDIPELEQLNRLGIDFCLLPYLNTSEQSIQVAILNKDSQLFKTWFLNHLAGQLQGGKINMGDLKGFTEGNYSIFNLPFEGEEFQNALSDFDILGINYSVLPDLRVGDGYSQVAIPNTDRSKLEVWFQMWRDQQIQQGKDPGDMYTMDAESYASTASRSEEEYMEDADQQYQEANAEFEKQAEEAPKGKGMQNENSEDFIKYSQDKNYEKISINKETLVDNMEPPLKDILMNTDGYFLSRIPGTYMSRQEILIVPEERIFIADDGENFVVFLPKNGKILVADFVGEVEERNFSDVYKSYDKVTRGYRGVKNAKEPDLKKSATQKKDKVNDTVKNAAKSAGTMKL